MRYLGGGILLAVGFLLLGVNGFWWALCAFGLLAWYVTFGKDTLKAELTAKPKHAIWAVGIVPVMLIVITVFTVILERFLGYQWPGDSAVGGISQHLYRLPIMMLGEELLAIGIFKGVKELTKSTAAGMVVSVLIFSLLHVRAYWDGDLMSTIMHVLLVIGLVRIFLNYIYLKTGSIWGSWLSHTLFDLFPILLVKFGGIKTP